MTTQHPGTAGEVFVAFFKLGLASFGGPVAHLGFFRSAFVERRRWLDEAAYADLVALCQFLPGPASSQVGIAIGKLRAGYPGAIAAFVAFTLPSVVLLLAVASGAALLEGPLAAGALHGLKVAALAVVAQAVWAMARTLTPDTARRGVALAAGLVALVLPSPVTQVTIIALAALAGLGRPVAGPDLPLRPPTRGDLFWLIGFLALLAGLPLLALGGDPAVGLIDRMYRTGALVFGGGHVVLPLLEADFVAPGLIGRDAFLAGYGAAQAVPGPLFAFAAYVGALQTGPPNGLAGALLALSAIYLPSFLLVFATLDWWQGLRTNRRLRHGLDLANAAVVGLLLAALIDPLLLDTVGGWTDLAWAAAALTLLVRRVSPPLVVLLSAATGIAAALASGLG